MRPLDCHACSNLSFYQKTQECGNGTFDLIRKWLNELRTFMRVNILSVLPGHFTFVPFLKYKQRNWSKVNIFGIDIKADVLILLCVSVLLINSMDEGFERCHQQTTKY